MHLIIDRPGGSLTVRNACFCISGKDRKPKLFHPARVTAIVLQQYAMLSTAAAGLAARFQIPLCLLHPGYPATNIAPAAMAGIALLRRRQAICRGMPIPTVMACSWLRQKMEGQMANIRWLLTTQKKGVQLIRNAEKLFRKLTHHLPQYNQSIEMATGWLGAEAYWAGLYWKSISHSLANTKWFTSRQQQNCTDCLNPALNYAYALLRHTTEVQIIAFGLDPSMGLLHADGRDKQPLVYDLMEAWRPTVDKWLLEWMLTEPKADRWDATEQGMRLSKVGRKEIATLFFEKATAARGRGRTALTIKIGIATLALQQHLQQTHYEDLLKPIIVEQYGTTTTPHT